MIIIFLNTNIFLFLKKENNLALHILTVDETTFKTHLEYMFIGTGRNGHAHQTGALADILSIRENDEIIFYVMKKGFFGIFKAVGTVFYDYDSYQNNNPQYLDNLLGGKTLSYRMLIAEKEVYKNYISEWDMMENPNNILNQSIFNMQWSWIFKKLNGNRGCLSIDNYEAELLKNILKNNNVLLSSSRNFLYEDGKISVLNNTTTYDINCQSIIPRDNNRLNQINIEEDLRILFTAKTNNHQILNQVLKPQSRGLINFISNEIACSFSERRMDLLLSTISNKCLLIELKNEFIFNNGIYNQIKEYSRWISSYKSHYQEIIPILIIKEAKTLPSRRGVNVKFKYLSQNDMNNDIKSNWYQEILYELNIAKINLINESIQKLLPLEVYVFTVDDNNLLTGFQQII